MLLYLKYNMTCIILVLETIAIAKGTVYNQPIVNQAGSLKEEVI